MKRTGQILKWTNWSNKSTNEKWVLISNWLCYSHVFPCIYANLICRIFKRKLIFCCFRNHREINWIISLFGEIILSIKSSSYTSVFCCLFNWPLDWINFLWHLNKFLLLFNIHLIYFLNWILRTLSSLKDLRSVH